MKYTFTFEAAAERTFREVLSRLNESEYHIVEDIRPVPVNEGENVLYADRTTVIDMEPDAALTFRLGMKSLKIRRERTEEELAEEKANEDRHKVKITVVMPTK